MAAEESLIGGIPLCYPKQMSTKRLFKLVGKKSYCFFHSRAVHSNIIRFYLNLFV